MNNVFSDILDKCDESDMILVGIGEEFQYDWDVLLQDPRYIEIEEELGEERWIVPFLQKMMLESYPDEVLDQAYSNLKKIIDGKNYFIITTAIDDYVYRYDFDEKRIVSPCGGFQKMQCDVNCCGQLSKPDNTAFEKVKSYFNHKIPLNELQKPICEVCGREKRFNQIGVSKYAEEGYLSQWELYTKWLQGTVNKKTCVIELGVGMQFPTIIRWPFERIVYYNQKAFLYRIHSSLYQLEEKIGNRGTGIKEKPVKFLANGFVK
ncbi:MAG: hypothetical protein J1D87_10625 [Lachnospiraceae bacterium]|nr:hypothetical protein [Lachnospiraceae bacterium]